MPRRAVGTTNIGVYAPLSELIDPSAPYTLEYVRGRTFPAQAVAKASNYNQAAGQWIFNIEVASNDGAWGYAAILYPYGISSTGTSFVGGTNQVYSFGIPYISIQAYPTYPRTFFGWSRADTGSIVSFTNYLELYPTNSIIADGYRLRAIFS